MRKLTVCVCIALAVVVIGLLTFKAMSQSNAAAQATPAPCTCGKSVGLRGAAVASSGELYNCTCGNRACVVLLSGVSPSGQSKDARVANALSCN